MNPLLLAFETDSPQLKQLQERLQAEPGTLNYRRFPDGESYLQIESPCENRSVVIYYNLFQPDEKILPLIYLAATLKELGAHRVGLVTPYLPYMRQDKAFHPGEAVTSRHFAALLSQQLDWLVTVDPHLHRYHSLDEIYQLQGVVVHAAPVIANWIKQHITKPLLIGPDSESEQWVSQVAELAGAPFQVLSKIRHGDYDVEVSLPEVERWQDHTPVLVDDIISSGKTMLNTVMHLNAAGLQRTTCIGVHGLFANDAYQELTAQADVITCDTVPHNSNRISTTEAIAEAVQALL